MLLALAVFTDLDERVVPTPSGAEPFAFAGDWVPVYSGALSALLASWVMFSRRSRASDAAVVAAVWSVVTSVVYVHLPRNMVTSEHSHAETLGVLVLVALAVRSCPPRRVVLATAAVAVALAAVPLYRDPEAGRGPLLLLGLVCAVGCGLLLRLKRAHRTQGEKLGRQEERLALARDLHDTVAHQVTAIVVQAQAVRHVTRVGTPDPETLDEVLSAIENAGSEALTWSPCARWHSPPRSAGGWNRSASRTMPSTGWRAAPRARCRWRSPAHHGRRCGDRHGPAPHAEHAVQIRLNEVRGR
ncbi:histidine kinase dimerization/phosphoacceptor domain-containing protein [Streptomyces sp. CA-135486]|uniref:histidine kinase dimerization/phosphoacceptor domain-containing protein n=1 Tax=Streptomyces sp. CA-135486 TaxID=3240049 RepID=UPI003D8BDD6F